jgi:tRNA pseudouridine55 synthase
VTVAEPRVTRPRDASGDSGGERAGLLAIDKPAGVTSHDVVETVRRRLRTKRAGHLGTLDPAATGLLLVATGAATRAIPAWQGGEKTYEAVVRFGLVTSTQDLQGEVLERSGIVPAEAAVRDTALGLLGETDQLPPMVSAIKVGGKRLYELARQGLEVEREPRRITVRTWDWLGFDGATARFRVVCSGGTYVRTLAHDLGQRLGCGAALEELRRLRSEPFGLERSVALRDVMTLNADEVWARAGWTLEAALAHLPRLVLTADEANAIGFGARPAISAERTHGLPVDAGPRTLVVADAAGRVLALGELASTTPATGALELRAQVVFPWSAKEGGAR